MEELAILRRVQTIYLHVDVENEVAMGLYRKAGYRVVETISSSGSMPDRDDEDGNADPAAFDEFTTSLNLHDGASANGKRHRLLCRDLVDDPTWLGFPPPLLLLLLLLAKRVRRRGQ